MQLYLEGIDCTEDYPGSVQSTPRAIECEDFPFEHLSRIAERESWRKEIYRPIYHIHKWWARRLGSVFRGILLGALTPYGTNVLKLFHSPARFPDMVVFDPFMGSGTTLGETLKLGARAIGRDINPVSFLQVRTALTLPDSGELQKVYREIEADVGNTISSYYTSSLPDGTSCEVLYYFWVMQASCPACWSTVDLFSRYVFARHAYPQRSRTVHVLCPKCGSVGARDYTVRETQCSDCRHSFDAGAGPVRGRQARCADCGEDFAIGRTIRATGSAPSYRMYAKLVLTPDGQKKYHPVDSQDHWLYDRAVADLDRSLSPIPDGTIEPGYNTNQVLNYGFRYWHEMFNGRQLLTISTLAGRIKEIDDPVIRDAFTCLFSGALEFNNMFASYKGEGTGAVRHMFYHHILKPERTPLEANLWGTPKSSGSFSTLFRSRLLRASEYARRPSELALVTEGSRRRSVKIENISAPLVGIANTDSYEEFSENARLYVSCGDSAFIDMPDECVDLVVTDPPFFDNVHYSQLADFFFAWEKVILDDCPGYRADTTRSPAEVQNSDATAFTERLTRVFQESSRVLKKRGLFIFTYHHSRWEGWRSVLEAVGMSALRIVACHPVKAELSVAAPKNQAKSPINFDIVVVCRKCDRETGGTVAGPTSVISAAFDRANAQIARLQSSGWELSRNDIGVVVMAQVVAEMSRHPEVSASELQLDEAEGPISEAIDLLQVRHCVKEASSA